MREGHTLAAAAPPAELPAPVADPSSEYAHVPAGLRAGRSTWVVITKATAPKAAKARDSASARRP